ncbi:MAG: PepSY-like domain-containing protein [Bacteroidia bacterium]|nr:PepSY-like domain-containing protein [Bacteroidia bacterium]MDW8348090.1 PepSY-like domain-containing protein [Bacteroidia bacterium]
MPKKKKVLVPPSEILREFKSYYPDIDPTQVIWSWEVPFKIYEAEFVHEGKEYEAEFTVTGHWLLTEEEIKLSEVPEHIIETAKARYNKSKLEEASKIVYSNGDVCYELGFTAKGRTFEVLFREDGLFIGRGKDL